MNWKFASESAVSRHTLASGSDRSRVFILMSPSFNRGISSKLADRWGMLSSVSLCWSFSRMESMLSLFGNFTFTAPIFSGMSALFTRVSDMNRASRRSTASILSVIAIANSMSVAATMVLIMFFNPFMS